MLVFPVMSKTAKPATAEFSFEKALAELEKIVAQMEEGGLSLEQSLEAHKRGLELAKRLRERLESAQQQVRVLEDEVLKPLAASPGNSPADAGERD